MSEFINKKEIIDMIDSIYNRILIYDNHFKIRTKKGTFGDFIISRTNKEMFIDTYNYTIREINQSNFIDYKVFLSIRQFFYTLSRILEGNIVKVKTDYINNKYVYTIVNVFKGNPIPFVEKIPIINKDSQGSKITKNVIESLREHYERFNNLDWTGIPNVYKNIELNHHTF